MAENMDKRHLVVTRLWEAVDSGSFQVRQVITSQDVIARVSEVWGPSVGVVISRIAESGLLTRLGDKKFEITEELASINLKECLDKVDGVGRFYKKRAGTGSSKPTKVEVEDEWVRIPFLELCSQVADDAVPETIQYFIGRMQDKDAPGIVDYCVRRLAQRSEGFSKDSQQILADLVKAEDDNKRLRQELLAEKERTMELRTEIGKSRGNAALHRVAEQTVIVETKPIPPGGQSGGSGNMAGSFVVHRKPLMEHTPKVIRRHTLDEPKK